jgi:large subunit ribosomal protein L4
VHGPQPRSYEYRFPRKKVLGALRSALAAKLSDGKLVVVESLEPKEAKTKSFRASLDKLNAKGTTLLVSKYIGETEKNLTLSARNLKGVELVAGNEVHPYHLLRYSSAVFERPALEKLQDSLKASAPKRKTQKEVA